MKVQIASSSLVNDDIGASFSAPDGSMPTFAN